MIALATRDLRQGKLGVVMVLMDGDPVGHAARRDDGRFWYTPYAERTIEPFGPFATIGDAIMTAVPDHLRDKVRAEATTKAETARQDRAALARWADDGGPAT